MKNKLLMKIGLSILVFCAGGCAIPPPRPTLYPNDHYQKTGAVQRDVDVQYCISLADNYVENPNRFQKMAESAAIGGVVGAGTGAIAGTILKEKGGRPTAAGAAVGAIVGLARELQRTGERSPSYQRFVEHCLQNKGYEVTGWNWK